MRRSDTSIRISGMKYSNTFESNMNSPRFVRDSEPPTFDLTRSVSHRQKERPSVSPQSITLPNGGSSANNRQKQDPCRNIKGGKQKITSGIRNIMDQLRDNYPRFSDPNKLSRTKSQQNFFLKGPLRTVPPQPPAKKQSQPAKTITEIHQKISRYSRASQQIKVQQASSLSNNLLQESKSPKRIDSTSQRCRQLCVDLKKKILKETISTTMTEPDEELSIKQFSLGRQLGKGKFSRVYLARHNKTGIAVALKIIKKETIRKEKCGNQLAREIKIQAFFNHVNLIRMYGFFADEANVYLILEYCHGGQLFDVFKVKSKLKDEEWIPLMKGICEGIYALHLHGVIHRDLKPENIMLAMGLPKIGDFGWAVYSPDSKRETFCGTPLYISPELLMGSSYDKEVDIWALGVMMYEFLTGRIPFKLNDNTNFIKIINSPIDYPKTLTPLSLVLMKMILNKDPETRIAIMDILEHEYMNLPQTRTQLRSSK